MTNIDKRLDEIEKKLDAISFCRQAALDIPLSPRSDEIDLRVIFDILWKQKWLIVLTAFLFSLAGIFYALSLPNTYKSKGVYALSKKDGSGTGMTGRLGGLASLAGVSLAGESSDIDQAIELVLSWPFLESFISEYKLAPLVYGVKAWDADNEEIVWNDEVYNGKDWLFLEGKEPSSFTLYASLKAMINIQYDKKSGMIDVFVEHRSPKIARDWVRLLVRQLNETFRKRDMREASKNIAYLEAKISSTGLAEMQAVFYGMIEGQLKTLMLAEVDDEYLIREVVAPKVPEFKSNPRRSLIVILFGFIGGVFSLVVVIGVGLLR